jgi:hypothetical protein
MIDVLGFEELVNNNRLDKISARMRSLFQFIKRIDYSITVTYADGRTKSERVHFVPNHYEFSDTIVLWTEEEDSLNPFKVGMFFDCLSAIVLYGLIYGLPLRIGAAFGECFIDEKSHLLLGRAINDAHMVEEAQNWMGGALHKSCIQPDITAADLGIIDTQNYDVKIPMKAKSREKLGELIYALHWFSSDSIGRTIDNIGAHSHARNKLLTRVLQHYRLKKLDPNLYDTFYGSSSDVKIQRISKKIDWIKTIFEDVNCEPFLDLLIMLLTTNVDTHRGLGVPECYTYFRNEVIPYVLEVYKDRFPEHKQYYDNASKFFDFYKQIYPVA